MMNKLEPILRRLRAGLNVEIEEDITAAKQEIKDLMIELIGYSPGIHLRDEECCDKCDVRNELRKKVEEL
jgi:hypothetical protein